MQTHTEATIDRLAPDHAELLARGRLALATRRRAEEDRRRTDDAMRHAAAFAHWSALLRLMKRVLPEPLWRWSNLREMPADFAGVDGTVEPTHYFILEVTPPGLAPVRRTAVSCFGEWASEGTWNVATYRLVSATFKDGMPVAGSPQEVREARSDDWPRETDLAVALALAEESEANRLALIEVAEGRG